MKKTAYKLNTTAYSLLGLIAKQPRSAYDLAQFMERSMLKFILPRSQSQLYNEPKKLAKLGLVTTLSEARQGRERTVYHVSKEGLKVYQAWLNAPGDVIKVEYKSLLKFYLSDPMDTAAMLARVGEMQEQTLKEARLSHAQISQFLSNGLPMKEVAMSAAMASRFTVMQLKSRLEWLTEARLQLEKLIGNEDPEEWAKCVYGQSQDELKLILGKYDQ